MSHPDMRVLTLTSYGETEADDLRCTIAPMAVKFCAAKNGTIQGREIKITTILVIYGWFAYLENIVG